MLTTCGGFPAKTGTKCKLTFQLYALNVRPGVPAGLCSFLREYKPASAKLYGSGTLWRRHHANHGTCCCKWKCSQTSQVVCPQIVYKSTFASCVNWAPSTTSWPFAFQLRDPTVTGVPSVEESCGRRGLVAGSVTPLRLPQGKQIHRPTQLEGHLPRETRATANHHQQLEGMKFLDPSFRGS